MTYVLPRPGPSFLDNLCVRTAISRIDIEEFERAHLERYEPIPEAVPTPDLPPACDGYTHIGMGYT